MFYLFNCEAFVKIESKEGRKTAYVVILPEISKKKYRNPIPEPGTTISGFADIKKKKKKKKNNPDRPTLDFFEMWQ